MSGYGGYYGKKYSGSVVTRIARALEQHGCPGEWRDLLRLARDIESMVRGREQARFEDWRD